MMPNRRALDLPNTHERTARSLTTPPRTTRRPSCQTTLSTQLHGLHLRILHGLAEERSLTTVYVQSAHASDATRAVTL